MVVEGGFCKSNGIVTERRVGERFSGLVPERPSNSCLAMRETHLAPRAAEVHWRLSPVIEMVLALARQYEPSTFDDILFHRRTDKRTPFCRAPPLRSQRADTAEVALQWDTFGNRWSLLVL